MPDFKNKPPFRPEDVTGIDYGKPLDELSKAHLDRFRQPEKVAGLNRATLVDPSGEKIPPHLTAVKAGQNVNINGCAFTVAYVGAGAVLLEPVKLPEPPGFPPSYPPPLPGSR